MTEPSDNLVAKRAWADIDLKALKKNLSQASIRCPNSRIIPVIKANGYGHGMEQVARALMSSSSPVEALAVATMTEVQRLQSLQLDVPIVLLPGFSNAEELRQCFVQRIEPVIHSRHQLDLLYEEMDRDKLRGAGRIWLKHNTGMNRLGLNEKDCVEAFNKLHVYPETEVVLMSHLACPDQTDDKTAVEFTEKQISQFQSVHAKLSASSKTPFNSSLAASAAILSLPQTHYEFVRPGIMLYGGSPIEDLTAEDIGLYPVMTLRSRLIAINDVAAGDSIGYGATFKCEKDSRIGVVSIGYGDGYPRAARNGTPVLVKTNGGAVRTGMAGRVSMDMITIDLTGVDNAQLGDEVVLWGEGLSADEVASCAGTISYELFCNVAERVQFQYSGDGST
ncbi:MAG: alanine racemase [Gammaproteobacteria bacterium]|jgi:alanine racemase|nr:alanine racemase [Gammaproteobacteria bacterium]MBT3859266.1 alanine racemase [Gammaproteobacteria bacterium]MBT3987956.1 alanine racemase [Gammaproteobacteria bacterium]MBT4254857.1 alanine racemase [Gammaproteobacteria bacterium]MBT4583146.1 alanine racemase [Gammaproteobacteria bacterium]